MKTLDTNLIGYLRGVSKSFRMRNFKLLSMISLTSIVLRYSILFIARHHYFGEKPWWFADKWLCKVFW